MSEESFKILLLDDDYESMSGLRDHLVETLGWDVELTADAGVLERLAVEQFDLLVVDLMIHSIGLDARGTDVNNIGFDPVNWRETGIEFLRRLRRGDWSGESGAGTPPDVPVLVLSAVADLNIKDQLQNDPSIVGYVEKPFRLDRLVELMRKALRR